MQLAFVLYRGPSQWITTRYQEHLVISFDVFFQTPNMSVEEPNMILDYYMHSRAIFGILIQICGLSEWCSNQPTYYLLSTCMGFILIT